MVGPKMQAFAQESTCSKETVVFWEFREHQFAKKQIGHDFRKWSASKIEVRKKRFLQKMVA